jgi:hypothetical protein
MQQLDRDEIVAHVHAGEVDDAPKVCLRVLGDDTRGHGRGRGEGRAVQQVVVLLDKVFEAECGPVCQRGRVVVGVGMGFRRRGDGE